MLDQRCNCASEPQSEYEEVWEIRKLQGFCLRVENIYVPIKGDSLVTMPRLWVNWKLDEELRLDTLWCFLSLQLSWEGGSSFKQTCYHLLFKNYPLKVSMHVMMMIIILNWLMLTTKMIYYLMLLLFSQPLPVSSYSLPFPFQSSLPVHLFI